MLDSTEEENKNEETEKDVELKFRHFSITESAFNSLKSVSKFSKFLDSNYFLELSKKNTPPPEFYF